MCVGVRVLPASLSQFYPCLCLGFAAASWQLRCKLSAPDAKSELSFTDVVDKFCKLFEFTLHRKVYRRPEVCRAFDDGRLCYVIGGWRDVHPKVFSDRKALIQNIAKKLDHSDPTRLERAVGRTLVVLTRDHLRVLLTLTLASLPPF